MTMFTMRENNSPVQVSQLVRGVRGYCHVTAKGPPKVLTNYLISIAYRPVDNHLDSNVFLPPIL